MNLSLGVSQVAATVYPPVSVDVSTNSIICVYHETP